MTAKFSVIIPTYNRARFIGEAIESVLAQSLPPIEIIVIDDGSTDKTEDAIKRFGSKITYLYQKNAGPSAARNAGIQHAQTEWIAFLDSDDAWMPSYLEKQSAQIVKYPGAVAHLSNAMLINPEGKTEDLYELSKFIPRFGGENSILLLRPLTSIINHTLTYLQTTVARKDVLIKAGLFPEDIRVGEDVHLMCRMALLGPFGASSKPHVQIHRRAEDIINLSALARLRGIEGKQNILRVQRGIRSLPGLNAAEVQTVDQTIGGILRALANLYMRNGQVVEARECFKRAYRTDRSFKSVVKLFAAYAPASVRTMLDRKARDVIP